MPFSHHSHSGEFCEGHAKDSLEDVIQEYVRLNAEALALTEHMPRNEVADFYPEEVESGMTTAKLLDIFDRYHAKARLVQNKYAGTIALLVGFEIDWIRPASKDWIETLLSRHQFDLFIGSVHHVHGIPIDYSAQLYAQALTVSKSSAADANISAEPEEMLFCDYYDAQYAMLQALKPPIVGHLDLIKLLSANSQQSPKHYSRVWQKVVRNLRFIQEYGGLLEINSAAVRKNLSEPYPGREITQHFNEMGGKFILSDDSHGKHQIGWGFAKVLTWLEQQCGVDYLTVFERGSSTRDPRFPGINTREISISELHKHKFFGAPDSLSQQHWGTPDA